MKKTILTLFLLLFMPFVHAQIHEVGFGLGGSNYVGNIGSTDFIAPNNLAYNIFYKWNRSPRHSYRVDFTQYKITGNDLKSSMESRKARGLSFDNNVQQLKAGIEFNFFEFDLHQEQFGLTPYLFAGLSVLRYDDLYFRGKKINKGDKKYTGGIPFSAGIKMRLTPKINVNAEVAATYTFTDNLDGSHPTSASLEKYSFGKNTKDWIFFTGITLSYTFGSNPCYCE